MSTDRGSTSAVYVVGGLVLAWLGYRAGIARAVFRRTLLDYNDTVKGLRLLRKLRWAHFWAAFWAIGFVWLGVLILLGMARGKR